MTNLLDLTYDELERFLADKNLPKFRAKQVFHRIYERLDASFDEISVLPKPLRAELSENCDIGNLSLETVQVGDGGLTRKALFRLPDGNPVEAVLMVYPRRATVCVSSQSGCAMGCTFCATAQLGFLKNLTSGQIVEQVLWAARELKKLVDSPDDEWTPSRHLQDAADLPGHLTNVVFMGMGEAFCNYDNWWRSVEQLHDPRGFNMGARSFTVSTVGLAPGIQKLKDESLPINLAISLHAARDDLREDMMPVNRGIPIQKLLEAVQDYVKKTNRRVTFEYILLQLKNDTPEDALQLAEVIKNGPLKDHRSLIHFNLIPWNPVLGTPLKRSQRDRVNGFRDALANAGIPCTIRIERGVDIDAACGQLAGPAA